MNVLENILKQIDELKENYWCDSKERKDGAMDMSNIIKDIIKQHLQSGEDNNVLADDWIPVEDGLPEERDSIFAKWKGTDKWNNAMFEKLSDDVNVTVEYKDGTRKTITTHTIDGQWKLPNRVLKQKVIAWRPLPEPYKPDPESADAKRQRERE